MKGITVAFLLMLPLSSCMSIINASNNFDETVVTTFKPGVTTEAEVIERLKRRPNIKTYNPDGTYENMWHHMNLGLIAVFNKERGTKMLRLTFDKNGVLQDEK